MGVWVTRSEPGASRLMEALQGSSITAVKCPALEIVDTSGKLIALEGGALEQGLLAEGSERTERTVTQPPTICVVVSQHAATRYRRSDWFQATAHHIAVGQATHKSLQCDADLPDQPTTEGILALPELQAPEVRKGVLHKRPDCVWIISGVGGRKDLGEALLARGFEVHKLELYERQAATMADFRPMPGDVIEVSSERALEVLMPKLTSAAEQQGVTLLLPSERIARVAQAQKFYNTRIARSAEIADVVAAVLEVAS